jgi:hypothetical protein
MSEEFRCPICDRITPLQHREKHHLTPKCKKGKETVVVCRCCGDMTHKLFSISELNRQYSTIDEIKKNEDVQKWIKWISKKPNDFSVCMATKKRK